MVKNLCLLLYVVVASLSLSINVHARNLNKARPLEQKVQHLQVQETQKQEKTLIEKLKEKKEISTTELIKLANLEGHLEFVEKYKNNVPFKEQIKKYGLQKTAEHLAEMKFYWIDLADKSVQLNDPNLLIEKTYLSIARQVGVEDEKFLKGHTNQVDKEVIKARAKVGEIDTCYYIKIIKNNKQKHKKQTPTEQYNELIKATFSREEYSEYCDDLRKAISEYYDALGKTLGLKIIFGKGDIDKMKKATIDYYFKKRDKLYPIKSTEK